MTDTPPPIFSLHRGHRPLLVSIPHAGRYVPPDVAADMAGDPASLPDTDHFVDQLYAFAEALGCSVLVARWSRWVIDLNRPPDNAPLYPGQAGTGLVPHTRFDGQAIWREGTEPDTAEVARRVHRAWQPYHAVLSAELERIRSQHGHVILWDAHSIRSRVPRLFDGILPDLNLGTNGGASCDPKLRARVASRLQGLSSWTHVVDGRFRGGHITRAYGSPDQGVHALQLELAQSAYMDEDAPMARWDADRAAPLQQDLRLLLDEVASWRP